MRPHPLLALALYGRNLLHHLGALLGALAPYLVQLGTARLGWVDASILSSGILIVWLLTNAHVNGKKASAVAGDITGTLQQLMKPGGPGAGPGAASPDLGALLDNVLGSLFGSGVGATVHLGPGTAPSAAPPPPGMEHLFPSGQPSSVTHAGQTVPVGLAPPTDPYTEPTPHLPTGA